MSVSMVIINEPKHHPDFATLTDEEIKSWWKPGHMQQIQAVLLSEQRQVWIGKDSFPAQEIWNDGEGFSLIESPGGNVYKVESVNTTGYWPEN